MEIAEVVMNPVRQRIFQYFLLHEAGTVKELKRALPDVPNASLYRHIKILADILSSQSWARTGSAARSKACIS